MEKKFLKRFMENIDKNCKSQIKQIQTLKDNKKKRR